MLLEGKRANLVITSPPYATQREYDPTSGFKPVPPEEYVEWFRDVAANIQTMLAPDGSYFLNIKAHADEGERNLYVMDLVLAHKRQWGWRFVDEFCWRKTDNGVSGGWGNRFKNAWEPVFRFCRQPEIKFRPKAVGHVSEDCFDYSPNNPKSTSGSGLLGTGARGRAAEAPGAADDDGRFRGVARPSNVIEARTESNQGSHSAPFPRGLAEFFVKAFTDGGDVVFDPFLGSGTTIAAAQVLGRLGYVCEHCGQEIQNHQKQSMLAPGEWRPSAVGDGKTAGFHLSSLYSPIGWFAWSDAAKQFEQAQKNPALLQVFVNTVLGETWTLLGEAPEWQKLYDRRESYKVGTVPPGALFLTAGADVQKDRIEVEIVGWGRGKESWSVDYRVFEGDTSRPQVWEKLTALLNETFTTTGGLELPVLQLAVDSGFAATEVYQWARRQGGRVVVIKGDSRAPALLGPAAPVEVGPLGKRITRGVRVWPVNSGMAKEELYRWLRLDRPTDEDIEKGLAFPPGYCHFPRYGEEYFKQITAEQLVTKIVKGYRRHQWQKMRERNEALDCRVYARAAASRVGIDRYQEKHWRATEERLGLQSKSRQSASPRPQSPAPPTKPRPGRRVVGRFST